MSSTSNGASATDSRVSTPNRFTKEYFDKWYRHPRYRVKSLAELTRQARFVVSVAELLIGRPIRTVLDVGCGEAHWLPVLKRLRPAIRYTGVDASDYVVRRYGKRRNIRLGTIETLDALGLSDDFDLILCVGMLNYVTPAALRRGLGHVHTLSAGAAYLEIFTSADEGVFGDVRHARLKSPAWYRRVIGDAGFLSCGMHCYLPRWMREQTSALERMP
jgi:SAM-dependent methyltransferase